MRGRGGWNDESIAVIAEIRVGQAKRIAGENTLTLLIDHAKVMICMTWRIEHQKLSLAKGKAELMIRDDDTTFIDRWNLSVQTIEGLLSIHHLTRGNQSGRIDHVTCKSVT